MCIPTTRKGREVTTLITLSHMLLSLFPGPCGEVEAESLVRLIRPPTYYLLSLVMDATRTRKNCKYKLVTGEINAGGAAP